MSIISGKHNMLIGSYLGYNISIGISRILNNYSIIPVKMQLWIKNLTYFIRTPQYFYLYLSFEIRMQLNIMYKLKKIKMNVEYFRQSRKNQIVILGNAILWDSFPEKVNDMSYFYFPYTIGNFTDKLLKSFLSWKWHKSFLPYCFPLFNAVNVCWTINLAMKNSILRYIHR